MKLIDILAEPCIDTAGRGSSMMAVDGHVIRVAVQDDDSVGNGIRFDTSCSEK
jgi:hypothetical protein